jgi:hypothetical protein
LLLLIIGVTGCTLLVTLALLIGIVSGGALSAFGSGASISIHDGSSVRWHQTGAGTVGELLDDIEFAIPADAALSHGLGEALVDGMTIAIIPARDVTLDIQGSDRIVRTTLDNPLEILESAGIEVSAQDKIWVNGALARYAVLPDWTIPARHITLRRSLRLTIRMDGEESHHRTTAETVGGALSEAGIALEDEGYDIEVVDPRTLAPLDMDTICESVRRTGRAVVCEMDSSFAGTGAEIAAALAEQCFHDLRAPIVRVGSPHVPMPFAEELVNVTVPDSAAVCDAVRKVMG